uniref:dehydrogenase/reductase SDR family member on chromosome X n=1 Tax=Erigeron canadensis TaxID=72917 RepID=UPI001CB98289|nr:dehydrogenase/reductase SDR family member on chromosome X [Erigeron canadensis]XP_043607113.1 dehydrogenase/reductase SDR family member on chromosome X [Erigeron canadensis]
MVAVKELIEALKFSCTISFWRMCFLWTFPLIVSYIRLLTQYIFTNKPIYNRCAVVPLPPSSSSSKSSVRRLPVCIITGATSGLGAAAALAVSEEGFFVVLAGRSLDKLSKVMSEIRKQSNEAHLEAFEVDLSSFSSIMRFKESLEKWLLDSDMHPSIQLLINNAGILATTSGLTAEGHDRMMGINYIGAFSLTEALLPLLKNSPIPSRIVNVTSFTHRNVSNFQAEKETVSGKHYSKSKHYPCAEIYENSKLCMLLFAYELHRQLHLTEGSYPISVMAADPGAVKTNIMREVPCYISQVAFTALQFLGLLQSPHNGISSILDASLAPPETSGLYFFGGNGRTLDSSALSYNLKLSRELWDTSCDIFQDSLLNYNRLSSNEKVD